MHESVITISLHYVFDCGRQLLYLRVQYNVDARYSKRRFRSPIHPSLSRSHSRKHCKFRSVLFADVVHSSTPYNTLPSSRLPLFPMFDQLSQKEGRRGKAIANINFHLRGRPAKGDPHVASFLATTNLKLFSVTLRKVE